MEKNRFPRWPKSVWLCGEVLPRSGQMGGKKVNLWAWKAPHVFRQFLNFSPRYFLVALSILKFAGTNICIFACIPGLIDREPGEAFQCKGCAEQQSMRTCWRGLSCSDQPRFQGWRSMVFFFPYGCADMRWMSGLPVKLFQRTKWS